MNRTGSAFLRVACGMFAVAWAALSLAPLANGTFATADLTAWNTLGNGSVVGAQGNIVPPVGSYQAQIGSGIDQGSGSGGNLLVPTFGFAKPGSDHLSGRTAPSKLPTAKIAFANDVTEANLETALNLPAGAIATALPNDLAPTDGSAIYQTFSALAGATLSFNWNFATNEKAGQKYDAALYTLQVGSNQAQVIELADTTQLTPSSLAAGAASPFTIMTGYKTASVNLPFTGAYTVGFISMQTDDNVVASATYIDNVQVVGGSPAPIQGPAPATWSLGLLGLGSITVYSGIRRLRKSI